jgi:hypothetical protein
MDTNTLDPWDSELTVYKKHSGPGLASFLIALVMGFGIFALLLVAGVLETSTPGGIDDESTEAMVIGFSLFGLAGGALVGLVLGIAGLMQSDRNVLFSTLGSSITALLLGGIVLLVVIGILVG